MSGFCSPLAPVPLPRLDLPHRRLGRGLLPVRHQPARGTFRNETAQQKYAAAQHCAKGKAQAPAEIYRQQHRVQEKIVAPAPKAAPSQ